MVHIETFVFFDIEATGFPWKERNRTKITELAFIAVSRIDLHRYKKVPPVNSKLTLLFNPQKYISPEVVDLTGLSNQVLEYCPTFLEKSKSMISFLDELPKPVCLVSHNGNSFDYKILLTECIDAKISLPPGLLCVDSLPGFRQLLRDTARIPNIISNSILNNKIDAFLTDDEISCEGECDPRILRGSLKPSNDNKLIEQLIINNHVVLKVDMNSFASECEYDDKVNEEYARILNQRRMADINRQTDSACDHEPEQQMQASSISKIQKGTIGRKVKNASTPKPKRISKKGEFTLTGLYKRLLNEEAVNAHRAEDDCLMLLKCVMVLKNDFLPWADKSCKKLSDIKHLVRY